MSTTRGPGPIHSFDIETDTSGGGGLEPLHAEIISIAVWTYHPNDDGPEDGQNGGTGVVFAGMPESEILEAFSSYVTDLRAGIMAGWNSSVFDLAYLATRSEITGVTLPIKLTPDPSIQPKYGFTPPHTTAYRATIAAHRHLDVCWPYRGVAERLGVKWSLKPVCQAVGIHMIEVDRESMHLLTEDELRAYNLSDVRGTAMLAAMLGTAITTYIDEVTI